MAADYFAETARLDIAATRFILQATPPYELLRPDNVSVCRRHDERLIFAWPVAAISDYHYAPM